MQQKVALARALLTQPILLLLDEPTTGLDPRSKLEVQDFIREIRQIHDATILLCTHDLDEAEALADRVGILDDGQAALARAGRGPEAALQRRDARAGVLRRDRQGVRGREARRGRGSNARRSGSPPPRADRPRRRLRAQRLPRQALHLVGRRVLPVDGREHPDDRLHREGHRGDRRPDRRRPGDDDAARRRRRLGLPRDHLRDPHRDGRLGALGGDDRVHVHGAALAAHPPVRDGRVRDRLRGDPRRAAVRRRRAVLRPRISHGPTSQRRSSCSSSPRSRSSGSG